MGRSFACVSSFALLLFFCRFAVYPAEYHVNLDGTGDFIAIQEAIDAAKNGDVIVVHPGSYYENIHFDGKNIALRSLDPEKEGIVASTIIDGGQKGSVVTFAGTEDETCLLSGFTITRGNAEVGGILGGDQLSDPPVCTLAVIANCTITRNSGKWAGGGVAYSGGTIENCTMSHNCAAYGGGGLVYCNGPIENCTVSDNVALCGGGLGYCDGPIENCTISVNLADSGGGLWSCSGTIWGSTVSANSADGGSGGGLDGCNGRIENCTITGNWASNDGGGLDVCRGTIENCTITGNSASWAGGGAAWCPGTITNCTLADNWAAYGGGLAWCSSATIANCVVWSNQAQWGKQLYACESAVITYCCVQGWTDGGKGNISEDPLFVRGPLGDYYLSCRAAGQAANSPCIDAGSDTAEALGLNELTTRTDGTPDAGIVDMGYHYALPPGEKPTIECFLNDTHFAPGHLLIGSLRVDNPGPDIIVDVYVAFVMPDGAIVSLTYQGFALGIYAWMTDILLPQGFHFGPEAILEQLVPGGLPVGNYLFAAALSTPGQFEVVGEASIAGFTLEAS